MKRTARLALAVFLALAAAPAGAEDLPMPDDPSRIVMNFEAVELTAFIKFISKVTGRNFVFGDRVEGTVSVVSPTAVNAEQAYLLFQSVLATQGLTTVDEGVVTRIVATKDARTAGATVLGEGESGAGFATRLVPLRYVNAADVARVLAPQISKDGSIVPYEGTNTVIVSDTASNLGRVADMIRVMDIPGHEENVAVIPLRHADAVRTSEQIVEILLADGSSASRRKSDDKDKGGSPATLGFKITPDERTNSLIVLAPVAEMRRIRTLAENLDVELRPGDERVHVYYAKNADAEALVQVVSGMILGTSSKSRSRKKDSSSFGSTSAPPAASDDEIAITADPATNAVIVEASMQAWRTIETLLEKLDIARPQVFIEAILVEASTVRAKALGLDYQGALDVGAGDLLLHSNLGNLGQAFINPFSLGGLVAAAASDKVVQLPDGTEVPANYALIQALDSSSDIEVLSAPTLLTLDNQEAEIIVGQNIPFVTGRAADITNVENVFTTVERRDVGIKLRVRPQVAEGDLVVLEVQQEVSALVSNSLLDDAVAQVGPTTTVRSANTTVSVRDGRTVVIGGLMSKRSEDGESKVPLLGDIPGLGRLFRYQRNNGEKVNLIVFLTPHVIRSPSDLATVTETRRDKFRAAAGTEDPLPGEAAAPPPPPPPPPPPAVPAVATPEAVSTSGAPSSATRSAPRPATRNPAEANADAPRHESTYRHDMREKNYRIFPLNRDTRERSPF